MTSCAVPLVEAGEPRAWASTEVRNPFTRRPLVLSRVMLEGRISADARLTPVGLVERIPAIQDAVTDGAPLQTFALHVRAHRRGRRGCLRRRPAPLARGPFDPASETGLFQR